MALRVQNSDNLCDIFMILAAANTVKTPINVSISADDFKLEILRKSTQDECKLIIQTENEFLNELGKYERIRTCSHELSEEFFLKAAKTGKHVASSRPLIEGRIELLHYVKEQSIAFEYHRYGSITDSRD